MRNLLLIFLLLPLFLQGQILPNGYGRTSNAWENYDSILWVFDPDIGVTIGSGYVSGWADQSGNGHNLSQTLLGKRPSLVENVREGHNAIRFVDGDYLEFGVDLGVKTIVMVFSVSNSLPEDCSTDTRTAHGLWGDAGTGSRMVYNGSIASSEGKICYSPRDLSRLNGYNPVNREYTINLKDDEELWIATHRITVTGTGNDILGGYYSSEPRSHVGDILYAVAFSDIKTDEELQGLENWLSNRFKIRLKSATKPIEITPNHLIIRDPTQVKEAPLEAWWGPGGIVGSPVSYWNDLSGNNHNWYQSNSSYRATVATKNGYNVLSFDGTNDYYAPSGTSLAHPDTFTIIFVANVTAKGVNNNNILFAANPTNWNDGGMFINMEEYGSSTLAFGPYYPNGSWGNRMALDGKLMTSVFERYGSNEWHVFAGRFMLKQTVPYSHVVYLATEQYLAPTANQNFKGSLAEVYWYSGYLSEKMILGLMRGLAEKYDITIYH